ncbi:MAG: acyl-CoA dehydratase activase [Lachnospiraceae bacterium]|nr:acyl-CoA dehydratase activase [Lachnospiraceae bacterium]
MSRDTKAGKECPECGGETVSVRETDVEMISVPKTDGEEEKTKELRLGIDIGSTTVKLVIIDAHTYQVIYSVYRRHHARQLETAAALLREAAEKFPGRVLRAAVCGSGGKPAAEALGVPYIQEVVANAAAVCALYPQARTAVELGGQDAKLIFFHYDEQKKELTASDMRMNGSCAGGTGAFIDEIAALLNVEPEHYEALAAAGTHVYDISGRCGVFAKTDIQPLLIQGAAREDIALSAFHAIAKQTIGGLSQGLELAPPIIFEGGPLTFHPTLVKVFAERLHLKEDEILIPEHPETIVARGAAIAIDRLFGEEGRPARLSAEDDRSARLSADDGGMSLSGMAQRLSNFLKKQAAQPQNISRPFFSDEKERRAFEARHGAERMKVEEPEIRDGEIRAYLGIDSGSTTSKMVLMDEKERVIDRFYASNRGQALQVVCDGIRGFYEKYEKQGVSLRILGVGTTGYGEKMLARAFGADYHIVETVAHATAAVRFFPKATFLLDIGGQDMKAIWLEDGVITNIMLNEACSSGCGSFLETFAESLNIPVEKISDEAFASENPAHLGSRCTVFMNSTIINEQRNGKSPRDIMAGLCRSIIENVFTKVVRLSNTDTLGDCVVVQGGTFNNAAVLRALEEYLGREVHLAPYSGEMGALGAAMLTRGHIEEYGYADAKGTSFIGREGLADFHYETRTGVFCPRCANHCSRTVISFSDGKYYVTGNRCERGEVLTGREWEQETGNAGVVEKPETGDAGVVEKPETGDAGAMEKPETGDVKAVEMLAAQAAERSETGAAQAVDRSETGAPQAVKESPVQPVSVAETKKPLPVDLFAQREAMLFQEYPYHAQTVRKEVIGLPRVLEFWDSCPFWSTFFRALGYQVRLSHKSSRKMYEEGLSFVASDTVCFPAKLVHGHVADLARQKVDRIFFPYIMHMPPEGVDKQSPYVCSVLQGYPMMVRNSQNPEERYDVIYDTPVFHWFSEKNRKKQICQYAVETLGVTKKEAEEAFAQGEAAMKQFRTTLTEKAAQVIDQAQKDHSYAVVLAGRPYHTDPFVSHDISKLFLRKGISVLPVDSLPGLDEQELKNTRIEITNNFHTRMLAGAMVAAENEALEYVQLVSFGCGHDAVLSDEIVRIMTERADKPPLILKVDESDAAGSLSIRTESFIETVDIRRKGKGNAAGEVCPLPAPSPVKFYKKDKKIRTLLVPNISAEVSVLLCGILEKENFIVRSVPVGGLKEIGLGKKYVHNDICFPCQMVIGELIGALQQGNYDLDEVAVGMVKFQCDCRMSHYAGLLRKGLDAAGFSQVPVLTTDMGDSKDMHPGVSLLGVSAVLEAVWSFEMLDMLTELCRKIRPYELHPGETDRVYQGCVREIADGIRKGIGEARKAFDRCLDEMAAIPYDRSHLKPRVFVTGELLVTYHPGSNFDIERYLERNGMEAVFPRITDQLRKDFRATECEISDYHADIFPYPFAVTWLFDEIQKKLEKSAVRHPLYQKAMRPRDMYQGVADIIPETLSCGEGWLMAAEIAHYAGEGVKRFVILQPFGCLPNHICGRGVIKKLKERFPDIQILPLDLDPDTSYANVENRLQMLLMSHD